MLTRDGIPSRGPVAQVTGTAAIAAKRAEGVVFPRDFLLAQRAPDRFCHGVNPRLSEPRGPEPGSGSSTLICPFCSYNRCRRRLRPRRWKPKWPEEPIG